MDNRWRTRCPPARGLVVPVPVDPDGLLGPTYGQARGPHWRRSSPRLYVPANVDESVEQRILEQSMRLPPGGVVTGWAALRLHGCGFFDGLAGDGRTPLDVPLALQPGSKIRQAVGVRVRRERLPDEDIAMVASIPCATAARATLDEMRSQPDLRSAVVVLDMALAAGAISLGSFARYVEARRGWAGSSRIAKAIPLADPCSESPQETRMRLIWQLDAGLPRPRCNVYVSDLDGNRIGRPDLLSEELAVVGEYDGAFHRDRERHRSDVRREDLFRRCGLETFTLVGMDVRNTRLVVERMRAAVQRSREARLPRQWMTRA